MELSGEVLIRAQRARVWEGLNDSTILSRCIPGCETITEQTPHEREVTVKVKVGPVRARFAGHIRMENIRPGAGCTLHFEGSGGAAGMAKGHSDVALTDEDGGTRLRYTAQAAIGGKLGQVGGRMIDAAAKQMADQFFTAFEKEMSGLGEVAPAPTSTASPPAGKVATSVTDSFDPRDERLTGPALPQRGSDTTPDLEKLRMLWFALGALSTGFGVLVAHWISS